jgi:NAD(P)-dependent dehydrogenase (short-subunit alcohol dehydrogenase family)
MARLKDKVAIVTGAAKGIGATYAEALAAEGARVCVSDVIDCADSVSRIKAAGGSAVGVHADVGNSASVAELARRTIDEFGTIDLLINNAAIFAALSLKPFTEISSEEFDRVMTVNVRGCFECAKAVVPHMRKRKSGKIVNIASATVFKGAPLMAHYVASKGAVIALTRSLAREVGNDGIQVNCLAPGLIMSEGVLANPDYNDLVVGNNVATRALKRDAVPQDLVGAVLFLASPDSDFMTGQTIVVDGGSVMH